jgi:hypothetical protein
LAKTDLLPTCASLAALALKLKEQIAPDTQKSFFVQSKPGTATKPVGPPSRHFSVSLLAASAAVVPGLL